jgi:Domain of unknown function (DUF4188)
MPEAPEGTYMAALWEHPDLCVGIFGLQVLSEDGQRLYAESGIQDQLMESLATSADDGLLLARRLQSDEGSLVMVYWSSYADLDRWARRQPHSLWWKWLVDNEGRGIAFYHEIYQAKAAEAVFTPDATPVGPGLFSSLEVIPSGKGYSRDRQKRFADEQANPTV